MRYKKVFGSTFTEACLNVSTIPWKIVKDSFSIISAIGKIINAKTEVASVLKIFDRDDHSSAREDLSAFNGLPTCQFKIWNPGGWLSSNNNK